MQLSNIGFRSQCLLSFRISHSWLPAALAIVVSWQTSFHRIALNFIQFWFLTQWKFRILKKKKSYFWDWTHLNRVMTGSDWMSEWIGKPGFSNIYLGFINCQNCQQYLSGFQRLPELSAIFIWVSEIVRMALRGFSGFEAMFRRNMAKKVYYRSS